MRRLHSQVSTCHDFDEDKSSTFSDSLSSPVTIHQGFSQLTSDKPSRCQQSSAHQTTDSSHPSGDSSHKGIGSSHQCGKDSAQYPTASRFTGVAPVPLFLHLTCTLRCPGIDPITTPMTALPTCLRKYQICSDYFHVSLKYYCVLVALIFYCIMVIIFFLCNKLIF